MLLSSRHFDIVRRRVVQWRKHNEHFACLPGTSYLYQADGKKTSFDLFSTFRRSLRRRTTLKDKTTVPGRVLSRPTSASEVSCKTLISTNYFTLK